MPAQIESKKPKLSRNLAVLLATTLIILTVIVLLLATSLQIFFNFQTQQVSVKAQQRLIAQEAASTVASFIQEKFRALEIAARLNQSLLASQTGQEGVLTHMLGLEPAFRQLILFDTQDQLLAKASRLSQISEGQITNRLTPDLLAQSRNGPRYISQIYIDETSFEPLALMVVPVKDVFGDTQGTLVAELNLKFMWDVVDQLQVGQEGKAFVVDRQGNLIAYGDSSRVLQGENLRHLAEVRNFLENPTGEDVGITEWSPGINDTTVLGTFAPLEGTDWAVVVETPITEAYRGVIQNGIISILIIVVVAGLAGLVGVYLARRLTAPLHRLTKTAAQIASGQLDLEAPAEGTAEVNELADAFNDMTAQLRGLIGNLEERVHERTRALETSAEISRQIITIIDLDELLKYLVDRLQKEFNFYHTHIYLIEPETGDLIMVEGSGAVGQQLKAQGHKLPRGRGIVGSVAERGEPFLAKDVNEIPNFIRNPLLPKTQAELAVPLRKGKTVVGVLDIQSEEIGGFSNQDLTLMQSIADQVAVAVDNARLFQRLQAAAAEAEELTRRVTRETWRDIHSKVQTTGYTFTKQGVTPAPGDWLPAMDRAVFQKNMVHHTTPDQNGADKTTTSVAVPLILRGEVIGVIGVERPAGRDWSEDEMVTIEAITEQVALALDAARLARETERSAWRDQVVSESTAKVWSSDEIEEVMRAAVAQLGQNLRASEVVIRLGTEAELVQQS